MSLLNWNSSDFIPRLNYFWDGFFIPDFYENKVDIVRTKPAVNSRETERSYVFEVAVPGQQKDDFRIVVDRGILTISLIENENSSKLNEDNLVRREYSFKSFERSFILPENVQEEQFTIDYTDGILKLSFLKTTPVEVDNQQWIKNKLELYC